MYIKQLLWDKAREQLEVVVKGDPANAEAHYLLGALYADQDSAGLMNRHFEQALKLRPKKYDRDIGAWRDKLWAQHYNSGVRAYQKDRLEDALKEFGAAAQADPTRADSVYANAYSMVGLTYLRLDQTEKGIEALRMAVAMDPRNKSAFINLGIAYHNARQPEKEVEAFEAAARLDPSADVIAKLAMGYETLAMATQDSVRANALTDSALAVSHRAIALLPNEAKLIVMAGRLHLNRAIKLSASDRKAEARAGYADAEEDLKKALELDPKDGSSAFNLGLCYNQLERYDDAVAVYRKAVEIDPKDLDSRMQLGVTQVRQKDYDGAIATFKQVVEVQPDHVRAYEFMATVYAQKDMPKEAKQAYETAQELRRQGKN